MLFSSTVNQTWNKCLSCIQNTFCPLHRPQFKVFTCSLPSESPLPPTHRFIWPGLFLSPTTFILSPMCSHNLQCEFAQRLHERSAGRPLRRCIDAIVNVSSSDYLATLVDRERSQRSTGGTLHLTMVMSSRQLPLAAFITCTLSVYGKCSWQKQQGSIFTYIGKCWTLLSSPVDQLLVANCGLWSFDKVQTFKGIYKYMYV